MSSVNSYNEIVDRLSKFASGHFNVGAFTHGQIDLMDLDKFPDYVCMHVFPASISLQKGSNIYSFTIWFMDLPRDKETKAEYQREAISDTARIASDLVYEIENGLTLFGDDIVINGTPTITPEIQEYSNVLTGVSLQISIDVPSEWGACDIPADWTVGNQGETEGPGGGPLLFEMSVVKIDGVVTLVNDEESPGNSYYYGTNNLGVKGWYIITGGGGSQDLQSVTDVGNTTTNDIEFGAGVGLLMANSSRLREGTIDAGTGGSKGIALICAVGYELKWEAGSLYIMNGNGNQIREVRYTFNNTPLLTDDSSKGFYPDSRWVMDNGDIYVCTDSTIGAAVWVLQTDACQCEITAEVDENGDLIITVNEGTPINAGYVVGPQGAQGDPGNTGPQGPQGDPGPQGAQGSSSTFFPYKAKTSSTSGNPSLEYLLWNNATQISATQINVSHEDHVNVDVDIFLALIASTQKFTIQDANNSANFQTWEVSGTPTNINPGTSTSYWTYPVTFVSSGGTGTTNFANNHEVIFAVTSGIVGPTGPTGPAGPAPSGTGVVTVTSGVLDTPQAQLGLSKGGTNKNLTAVAGGVVWTDADSMEVSAAGTSGQYLKSNGSSAPSWDKPTNTTVLSATLANNAVALSTTNYYTFFGTNAAGTALEPPKQIPSPTAMTLSAFYFRTNSAQSGTGSLVINIRKGAANTGITITIAAGSATGTFTDLSNTASIAAGDLLSIQIINNATAASTQMNGWAMIGTI